MRFNAFLSTAIQAALFVAAVSFAIFGLPPRAEAGPSGIFSVPGCPLMRSITPIARKIFGSYQWSAAGGAGYGAGRLWSDLLPAGAGAYLTECVFVREWDVSENAAAPDSDVLVSGYAQLSNSAALLQTWKRVKAKFGLTSVRSGPYHFAERKGLSVGYRGGLNEIAFAYWSADGQDGYQNVPGSRLRPFITTILSP